MPWQPANGIRWIKFRLKYSTEQRAFGWALTSGNRRLSTDGSNGPPRMPLNLAIVGDFFISSVTRRTNFIVALEMSKRRWKYHHVSTWVAGEATTIAVVSNSTRQKLSSAAEKNLLDVSKPQNLNFCLLSQLWMMKCGWKANRNDVLRLRRAERGPRLKCRDQTVKFGI